MQKRKSELSVRIKGRQKVKVRMNIKEPKFQIQKQRKWMLPKIVKLA